MWSVGGLHDQRILEMKMKQRSNSAKYSETQKSVEWGMSVQ
jgi:hypothetical protein